MQPISTLLDTLGLQLWTVRKPLAADPVATLDAVAAAGYHQVELMDTRQAASLLPICKDVGLAVNSSFMLWTALTDRWDLVPHESRKISFSEILDQASEAGLEYLVFGYLTAGERQSLDDYRKWADLLNQAADKARSHGLKMAYHHHNFEFAILDGGLPFDVLVERLDPSLVAFELDVFWASIAGQDPAEWIKKLSNRIALLHLKDLKPASPVLTNMEEVAEDAFQALGNGCLPILALAELASQNGLHHAFVEQDFSPDPLAAMQRSIRFLRSLV